MIDKYLARAFEGSKQGSEEAMKDALALMNADYNEIELREFRTIVAINMRKKYSLALEDAFRTSLLISAPHNLDCFMRYMEIDRKPEEAFWLPRRGKLYSVCEALQEIEDGQLKELGLSQPPRTGKTTLIMFFVAHEMGKNTEFPKLYSSYSDLITTAFYNGINELIADPTYKYKEIFPKAKIVKSNSKDETLDLERQKHYPTLTCRSLYGTLNGACDAEGGIIIADDLIGGIEEALNKDRLISAWYKVDNNLIPRGKESTRYVWMGTRWSLIDPTGIRFDTLANDIRYRDYPWRYINIPALNDQDESNFVYKYGVGFSTDYYKKRRASFERNNDIASWNAQYQGEPIEREGTLFSPDDLRYFNGVLPDDYEPDKSFTVTDPAWGGGDFTASVVCKQYDSDVYVVDVVFSNGDKKETQPLVASKIIEHEISYGYFEGTKTTASYSEGVDRILKDNDYHANIQNSTKHYTSSGKEQRIFDKAPDIREHFIFLETGKRSRQYELFMQNVFSFKFMGKNAHDDAPDALAMAAKIAFENRKNVAKLIKRPF